MATATQLAMKRLLLITLRSFKKIIPRTWWLVLDDLSSKVLDRCLVALSKFHNKLFLGDTHLFHGGQPIPRFISVAYVHEGHTAQALLL